MNTFDPHFLLSFWSSENGIFEISSGNTWSLKQKIITRLWILQLIVTAKVGTYFGWALIHGYSDLKFEEFMELITMKIDMAGGYEILETWNRKEDTFEYE